MKMFAFGGMKMVSDGVQSIWGVVFDEDKIGAEDKVILDNLPGPIHSLRLIEVPHDTNVVLWARQVVEEADGRPSD